MTTRHRRRALQVEAIAPWAALAVVLLAWWAGATLLDWAREVRDGAPVALGPGVESPVATSKAPTSDGIDRASRDAVISAGNGGPTISANTAVHGSDLEALRGRSLLVPVRGLASDDLVESFTDARGSSRRHEAIDILAPRGTEVLAVEDGKIAKIFTSDAGGLTLYQFDPSQTFVYYYAHLDSYAPGLKEGMMLRKGDVVGTVGTTGNAPKNTPHLHFAIAKLDPDKRWWGGTALDPFLVWRGPSE
ncbi:MAG TPA: M23 family metallopeptidase [Vicinamibacterales bacterium]|nr:M23 family metallopeptidase [Vicinamibacterales bacterium]